METVLLIMVIIVSFNFVLKLTFNKLAVMIAASVVCALFIALTWQFAIEQSKTQLADWLQNASLMLDIAVVLSVEVILALSYCIMTVHVKNTPNLRTRTKYLYYLLRWFPGLLIFPVLFHIQTVCMFTFTGVAFSLISYTLAVVVALAIPFLAWSLKWLIPEEELRLEVFFLSNILITMLGVIATVNGRTAVAGITQIDWSALLGVIALTIAGTLVGYAVRRFKHSLNFL